MNVDIVTNGRRPVLRLESDDGFEVRELGLTDSQLRAAQIIAERDLRTPPDRFELFFKKTFALQKDNRLRGADVWGQMRKVGFQPADVPLFQDWLRARAGVTIARTHGARFYVGLRIK